MWRRLEDRPCQWGVHIWMLQDMEKQQPASRVQAAADTPKGGCRVSFTLTIPHAWTLALTALCTYAITAGWPSRGDFIRLVSLGTGRASQHPVVLQGYRPDSSPFGWQPCFPRNASVYGQQDPPRFYCGSLTVPLDYTNASDTRTVKLALTKYVADPHAKSKSERTLVVNPGGPGGSGGSIVYRKGQQFNELLTDGKYDVVGWDPRGVNLTDPSMSCFPRDAYRDRWRHTQQWAETGGYHHLVVADAMNEAVFKACEAVWGDLPRFLSTAFVARDMDAIREALGEEELTARLISYGTGIGQTYTQLFPDRVGRIVMDGMEYVKDGRVPWGWGTTSLDNVTAAWEDGLLGECVAAGPSRCALVRNHDQSADNEAASDRKGLIKRMDKLFQAVLERPVPAYNSKTGPGIISYEDLIGWIYQSLYRPVSWPKTALALSELERGNGTLVLEAIQASFFYDPDKEERQIERENAYAQKFPVANSAELSRLVICGDSYDAPKMPLSWWADLQKDMIKTSFISGSPRLMSTLPCRHYNYTQAEVYRGDFDAKLKNPVMLVSETYDPATPLRNGRKLAKEMGDNARLIVHHGYGHASDDRSKCTDSLMRALYLEGSVPTAAETDCYADEKPYPEGGEDDKHFTMQDYGAIRSL